MVQVLCIGHSAYDMTIPMPEFPIENKKYNINTVLECGGGPAGNAACLISKWGINCGYAGIIGNDIYGKKIREEYEKDKVDLRYLVVDNEYKTPFSVIIANQENGSRTLFNYDQRKNSVLSIAFEEEAPKVILVDGHAFEASVSAIEKYPTAISVLDAGSFRPETEKLAQIVDYLVCSEDFAKEYLRDNQFDLIGNPLWAFSKLKALNHKNIVITLGEKGCIYTLDREIKYQPAYKVKAIDSTGAGDIFHGAFAFCLSKGFDLTKTIKISSIAAALSVQKIGGRVSIPSFEEVMVLYGKNII